MKGDKMEAMKSEIEIVWAGGWDGDTTFMVQVRYKGSLCFILFESDSFSDSRNMAIAYSQSLVGMEIEWPKGIKGSIRSEKSINIIMEYGGDCRISDVQNNGELIDDFAKLLPGDPRVFEKNPNECWVAQPPARD